MAALPKGKQDWFRLDNAGVLYSAIQKEKYSAIYRFTAVMQQQVQPQALQRAVDQVMPRFPGFCVLIKRGFFWYYFEPNRRPGPFVKEDIANPCQPVRFHEDNGWLVRFYYYEKRISVEVFHALSDGAGALVFFRTLLAVYLRNLGYDIPNGDGVLDVEEQPRKAELEDSYGRFATVKPKRGGWEKTAYANTSVREPFYTLNVIVGVVPLDVLRQKAKESGASITEYLAATLISTILQIQKEQKHRHQKPVALAVPINLRPWFPSETLRNFIITVRPYIDPGLGEYTFLEIISQVRHYMRLNINRQQMQAAFTSNVKFTTNRVLQLIPVFLKNPVMAMSYSLVGTRPYSATYTNPGAFEVPAAMAPHIVRMEAMLGQATVPRPTCASMSYGNVMTITFAGTGAGTETEQGFFRRLVKAGIPVKVESNRTT